MKTLSTYTTAAALVITLASALSAQEEAPHPKKVAYAGAQDWPATAPGEVSLRDFEPFRAVYDRDYRQGSGPNAGEPRRDRVIVYADEVGWDGRQALAITLIDSGTAEHADTNMRTLTTVAALDDLSLLFEMGPAPGKAKDYYIALVEGQELNLNMISTAEQRLQPQKRPIPGAGFGPGAWVMASMDLEIGKNIHLAPYFSPQATPLSQTAFGRVIDRRKITDGSGGDHEAWVVEAPGRYPPPSPKVLHIYLKPEPPYYLGTETVNLDSDERSRFVWLREFVATAN